MTEPVGSFAEALERLDDLRPLIEAESGNRLAGGAVTDSAGSVLESVELFDVYAGDSLGEGRKSLAVKLVLRAPDRTLSDEEAAPIRRDIVTAVEAATGGTLRGEL